VRDCVCPAVPINGENSQVLFNSKDGRPYFKGCLHYNFRPIFVGEIPSQEQKALWNSAWGDAKDAITNRHINGVPQDQSTAVRMFSQGDRHRPGVPAVVQSSNAGTNKRQAACMDVVKHIAKVNGMTGYSQLKRAPLVSFTAGKLNLSVPQMEDVASRCGILTSLQGITQLIEQIRGTTMTPLTCLTSHIS
jgi:hypothetical protein